MEINKRLLVHGKKKKEWEEFITLSLGINMLLGTFHNVCIKDNRKYVPTKNVYDIHNNIIQNKAK